MKCTSGSSSHSKERGLKLREVKCLAEAALAGLQDTAQSGPGSPGLPARGAEPRPVQTERIDPTAQSLSDQQWFHGCVET